MRAAIQLAVNLKSECEAVDEGVIIVRTVEAGERRNKRREVVCHGRYVTEEQGVVTHSHASRLTNLVVSQKLKVVSC